LSKCRSEPGNWVNCAAHQINAPILFSNFGNGLIFLKNLNQVQQGYGWSFPEAWGIWSDGSSETLILPLPKGSPRILRIEAQGLISKSHPSVKMLIEINHLEKIWLNLTKEGSVKFDIPVPANLSYPEFMEIKFHFLNAASPIEIGMPSSDTRKLALGLISATFLQ
jgi:hypothetical protein